jgi:hypothetical protein
LQWRRGARVLRVLRAEKLFDGLRAILPAKNFADLRKILVQPGAVLPIWVT